MLWPDLYQHDPGGLNEQTAQIAIAALRYAAEDRAVACRYLLRHQSKPGAEVAAFREHVSSADRGYHRARDDRADARDRHQSLAAFVLTSQCFDLAGEVLNARVQSAPLSCTVIAVAQHARREDIGARREDTRQLGPQGTQALPHGDAPLQQERTDLIDDAGTLTGQSLAHAVQRLQVELVGGLGRDELHGRALDSLGDGFRISHSSVPSNRGARISRASVGRRG